MTLNQKIAYIKGLADGLELDAKKPEVKVINEILQLLEDLTISVTATEDLYDELSQQVDEMDEDLADLESAVYDECECDGECCDCGDDCFDIEDDDNPEYEVTCPECDAVIVVDEDKLLEGEIQCPNCDYTLEFDFTGLFGEDGCSCGNPDCDCANS